MRRDPEGFSEVSAPPTEAQALGARELRRIGLILAAPLFAWPDVMMKFCKNLAGPCPAPSYLATNLPTYLPYLWETKKEITGG